MNIYSLTTMSSLFTNMNQTNNSNSNMNLYSAFSEYSMVKSGVYKKLVKSYYEETGNKFINSTSTNSDSETTSKEAKQYTEIKSATDSLSKSTTALVTQGTKSLFKAKETKNVDESTGEETTVKEYDMKAIKEAVNSFIKEYNDTIDVASETDNQTILRNTLSMTKQTAVYESSLEKIGITINEDNSLSLNEETFNSADITSIKSLFNDSQSFAAKTLYQSNRIGQNAVKAATNTSIYSSTGNYSTSNYYSVYNWFL